MFPFDDVIRSFSHGRVHDECVTYSHHYSDVTWVSWHLKSLSTQLFFQLFVHASIEENIKAYIPAPLWGKFASDCWLADFPQCGLVTGPLWGDSTSHRSLFSGLDILMSKNYWHDCTLLHVCGDVLTLFTHILQYYSIGTRIKAFIILCQCSNPGVGLLELRSSNSP